MLSEPTEADFLAAVLQNPKVVEVLARAEGLDLTDSIQKGTY